MKSAGILFACALLLGASGCASNNLKQENEVLRTRILAVQEENQDLKRRFDECSILSGTLEREKQEKDSNLSSVRAQARGYIRSQFDALNRFSRAEEWLDYLGGERLQRRNVEDKGVTIVAAKEGFASDAVIYKVKGYFEPGTRLSLKLFRPSEAGLLCIWESPVWTVAGGGPGTLDLATPLAAQKGDRFGFYFPDRAGVSFDEKTGGFAVFPAEVRVGDFLPGAPTAEGRNYSIGVAGMLE